MLGMRGVVGAINGTDKYWYTVTYLGVEVEAGRGLTNDEMVAVMESLGDVKWIRDYDTLI